MEGCGPGRRTLDPSLGIGHGQTPERSARQLHDESRQAGTQPANIRLIYRRNSGPAPPRQENQKNCLSNQIAARVAPGRLQGSWVDPIPAALRSVGCLTEVLKKQKNNKGQKEYACIRHPYQDGWSEAQPIKSFQNSLALVGGLFVAVIHVSFGLLRVLRRQKNASSRARLPFRNRANRGLSGPNAKTFQPPI